jgi:hypothetical protein
LLGAQNGADGSEMMGTDDVGMGDHVGIDVVLGEELHSMRYVGIDTDSSRGASTVKADFLYLSCSKAATAGKALHEVGWGVGGGGGGFWVVGGIRSDGDSCGCRS